MTYLLFAVGLAALFFGGEALVRGAVGVARRYHVSPLVIGLTIVGFGTSTPELLVSLDAALQGEPAIAIGNVVGSNIGNILLILGLAALIAPMALTLSALTRDFAFMIGATLLLWALMWNGTLGRIEGAAMLAGLALYVFLCLRQPAAPPPEGTEVPPVWRSLAFVAAGLAILMVGARLLVDSSTEIARTFGVSEAVIGLTIVAVGTSLPELATSLVAAFRKQSEIAVGNILGSNIYNILGILGVTALITPVPVEERFVTADMWWALGAAVALLALAATAGRIGRAAGAALLLAYAAYVFLLLA